MTREEVSKEVLSITNPHILLELPTSFGKSKLAIDRMVKKIQRKKDAKVLIVIPRLVLENDWKREFKKWKKEKYFPNLTFTTYISLPKHAGKWDVVIFDECHHLSERCQEALNSFEIASSVLLSATVKRELKQNLPQLFKGINFYNVSTKKAIEEEILPDPTVYLIPLNLLDTLPTETIIKNPKGKGNIVTSWATRWNYIRQQEYKVTIHCTQAQYHQDLCSQIEFWKNKYMRTRNEIFKNKWLQLCGQRLKFLSECKIVTTKRLLRLLSDQRTLTFCNSIEQTELLGKYCINSKNKESQDIIEEFNDQRIDHITACNMLNEGANLVNCRIGIYNNLNSSDIIIKQRLGRILRHKDPIIIVPYYIGTREEELVEKMLEDYNPELVKTLVNIEQLKL